MEELLNRRDEIDLEDGSHLDYKEMLHLSTRDQRREFAKDLVGFANTRGGFLVIGVEDETWNPVGIDPQQFDSERIERIGREGLRPMMSVTARLVPRAGLHFGVIHIPKTHEVHCTPDGRVYIRIGRSTEPADPSNVARLHRENAMWIAAQNALGSLEGYRDQEVDDLLEMFAEKLTSHGILGRFSQKKREKSFFALKIHQETFESFKQGCTIRVHPNQSIDEAGKRLIMLRGYGLLAGAYLRSEERGQPNQEPIIITMEFDPLKRDEEGESSREEELFFEWLEKFKEMPEREYDREIYRLNSQVEEISNEEFLQFMGQRFEWAHIGAARALKLVELTTEMWETRVEHLRKLDLWTWVVLANLGLASTSDLFALKIPYRK
ncbi:MAG: ATP-binding protein [Candidatus Thorarchaeota archaeon]